MRLRRANESGTWEPDLLEWVEDEQAFEDWVALGEDEAEAFLDAQGIDEGDVDVVEVPDEE